MKFFLSLLFGLTLFTPSSVYAVGVGAAPSSFDFVFENFNTQRVELTVFNISDESGFFEVSPDELSEWVTIDPVQFELAPNERRVVVVTVTPSGVTNVATNLSVVAHPVNRQGFAANSALKVPLRIRVEASGVFWPWSGYLYRAIAALVVGFGLLAFLILYVRKKKRLLGAVALEESLFLRQKSLWWRFWKR